MTDPREPLEKFNALADMKALMAQLDETPSEEHHIGVLPLEWLAKQAFESGEADGDDRSIVIEFLASDDNPQSFHALSCEACFNGILQFAILYRRD